MFAVQRTRQNGVGVGQRIRRPPSQELREHLHLELYAESNGKTSKVLEAENGRDHLF